MLNYQRVIIVVHLHILSISLSMAISTGETETYSFHLISPFLVGKSKLAPGSLLPFYHPRPLRNHGTGADLFVFASNFSGPGWVKITGSNGSRSQLNHLSIYPCSVPLKRLGWARRRNGRVTVLGWKKLWSIRRTLLGQVIWRTKAPTDPENRDSRLPTFLMTNFGPCGEPKNRNPPQKKNKYWTWIYLTKDCRIGSWHLSSVCMDPRKTSGSPFPQPAASLQCHIARHGRKLHSPQHR